MEIKSLSLKADTSIGSGKSKRFSLKNARKQQPKVVSVGYIVYFYDLSTGLEDYFLLFCNILSNLAIL